MEKDEKYQMYAMDVARNIPDEILKHLIGLCMEEASLNMGNEYNQKVIDRVIYFIKDEYHFLPMNYIASAFIRGSLGQFGAGRLIPRVIYGWLHEVVEEYNRFAQKEKLEGIYKNVSLRANLLTYPLGQAINQKLKWYEAGLLDGDKWDHVNLMKLAAAIGEGHMPIFRDFYDNN